MASEKGTRLILLPVYLFTILFVFAPVVYLIYVSFMTRADTWGFTGTFTVSNYINAGSEVYLNVLLSSFMLSAITVVILIAIGYPFGYFMARLTERGKKVMMILVLIPFWTSELVRLRGWSICFSSNGLLDKLLMELHITEKPLHLMYSYPIVVFGMVFALLPFMILCVYSSVEKTPWNLVEASRDLGASSFTAFWDVTFKLSLPGLMSGIILTFIPSMGLFYISDILGGNKIVLIGSVIEQQATKGRNLPFAAALAVILMVFTVIMLWAYRKITHTSELEGVV